MQMKLSTCFWCVLLLLIGFCGVMHGVTADATNSSVRSFITDISSELNTLTCTQNKLNAVISLLCQVNGTSDILAIRRKQVQKIQTAIDQLSLEKNILVSKCNRTIGDNCNQGCLAGYIGSDCSQMACFGVSPSNASACSGRGMCIGPDTCVCTSPFFGNNCQSYNITNTTFTASVGYKYTDGKYARSCNEYRFPSIPYVYSNEGSGLYQIKPGSTVMTVYCDMTTDGGGWTLFAGIRMDYKGPHFHPFDDNSAVATSDTTSFHIKTEELLNISKQIRAATDKAALPLSSFYTEVWSYSAACDIPALLRSDIQYTRSVASYAALSTYSNPDRAANCKTLTGTQVVPTHVAYCKTSNGQSVGFRMGRPNESGILSHMSQTQSIYVTFTYLGAPEGGGSVDNLGIHYNADMAIRNGALFLR